MSGRVVLLIVGMAIVGLVWLWWPDEATPRPVRRRGPDAGGTVDSAVAFTNALGMKFVRIEAGDFTMGPVPEEGTPESEDRRRPARIERAFLIGLHEVTQVQWEQVMDANPSHSKGDHFPLEQVTWHEAMQFCRKLGERMGGRYRLPTEAEWEYACRAGTSTRFSFGDGDAELYQYANYCDMTNRDNFPWIDLEHDDGYARTAPVGSYAANPWGLHDMHGNVLEWCLDPSDLAAASDPDIPDSGDFRAVRGGSWGDSPQRCRSGYRLRSAPDSRSFLVGFRVVLEIDE